MVRADEESGVPLLLSERLLKERHRFFRGKVIFRSRRGEFQIRFEQFS